MISTKPNIPLGERIVAHIQLADPITWISASVTALCGALASGKGIGFNPTEPRHWGLVALGAVLTGPLCTGFSQSINDYYDRDLDAINDPTRPIPSGRVSLLAARINWITLAVLTFVISLLFLNPWIVILTIIGLILSAIYSVPPIKLKKNFWLGPPAVGVGYVAISWMCGHLIFAPLTIESVITAIANGGLAAGLIFLNDIKSIEGDRRLGMKSMTVALGVHRTLIVAYVTINLFEFVLLILSLNRGNYWVGGFICLGLVVPLYNQVRLYREPTHANFKRYLLVSNPFIALTQIISAFMVGGYI